VVKRHAKLLWFIPVDYDIGVQVGANGAQNIDRPWWGFLTDDKMGTATPEDMNSMDQLKLQKMMDQKSQLESAISNIMKAFEDTQGDLVNNSK